ncbi:MAG TPA: hypothetical protein VNE71_14020 [Myxococcota bacterium]|nr:hypothetical protein [Myxococcota bacterium]
MLAPLRLLPLALLVAITWAPVRTFAGDGFVSEASSRRAALRYLRFATEEVQPGSVLNAIAHMERARVDRRYSPPPGAVAASDWNAVWDKLDHLRDTRDFDALYLLNALLGYEDDPYLQPEVWERIRSSLLEFKMWFTDPTPEQPDPAEPERDWDDSYYWSENHQLLFHTIEYLTGQRFPDACFGIRGLPRTEDCTGEGEMTGAAHRTRARGFIDRWMQERWEAGYAEWLSNVYYQKDVTPLLTLAEFADDPELATRASILLDALLLDIGSHMYKNVFGTTHGRSYMKDKYRGPDEDTWHLGLLLFGKAKTGYLSRGDAGATLFARAQRYRLPAAIEDAATDLRAGAVRTRQSYAVDELAPLGPAPAHPEGHPFGDDDPAVFTDADEPGFTFWWGLGAQTIWQVVPLTVLGADLYNLWPTSALRPFQLLRDLLGEPPDLVLGQDLASSLATAASLTILSEANTYTWRQREFMLSTVQDWRKGRNAAQVHAWQATLGEDAIVFTQHPANPVQPPSEWIGRDEGSPGYWTGSATMPRSAQFENVGIHIYSPAYPQNGFLGFFPYEPMTHAYFPRDHFDTVVKQGHWTLARKGGAYLALYSWRDTEWQEYSDEELALPANGPLKKSFDLVASGGADNVWIVELGRQKEYGSFAIFRKAFADVARVKVTPRKGEFAQAFDVVYTSPGQGRIEFGWDAPFEVKGKEIPLAGYPRVDSRWVTAERGDPVWEIRGRGGRVTLDWPAGTRTVEGGRAR